MFIKAPFTLTQYFAEIIEEELNVKKVTFTDDVRLFTTYSFKPQLKTVGPKYGKLLNQIREALSTLNGNEAMDGLNATGELHLDINGEDVVLTKEDLLIDMTQMEGYVSENNGDVTVVLDCNLTPELLDEGMVRELISKIQTMRKEADFEVTDHITVTYEGTEKIASIFEAYKEEIKGNVLADEIVKEAPKGYVKEWNINGEQVTLGVER